MTATQTIGEALTSIFHGIARLHAAFPSRAFTIDGRLVGDVGEVLAELAYDLTLDEVSAPDHDARMRDGRRVQIKATFKNSLTFKRCPDYYLGLQLHPNGEFDEIYNGPGMLILKRYSHRKGIGEKQLSFPITDLSTLSVQVNGADRVPRRQAAVRRPACNASRRAGWNVPLR